jgi:periplasmic copper chaperone A
MIGAMHLHRAVAAATCTTVGCVLFGAAIVSAHTETDVVAVPASEEAAVTFRPQHGCGDSPTVAVLVRAPVADAVPEEVDGWQSSSSPDGQGNTVLEWSGGSLPSDQPGAFPVEFVAPDTVGSLLTFPAVQRCENGEELAWISGDPAAEYPAPRLLILAAGSAPAATIDDVALDAPGREQLVSIVDVDNPGATPTTTTAAVGTTLEPAPQSTVPASAASTATATPTTDGSSSIASTATEPSVVASAVGSVVDDATSAGSGDGSSAIGWAIAAVVRAVAVAAGVLVWRRRAAS